MAACRREEKLDVSMAVVIAGLAGRGFSLAARKPPWEETLAVGTGPVDGGFGQLPSSIEIGRSFLP